MASQESARDSLPLPVWLLFLLGGLGGAACDQLHVQFGVLEYASKDIWDQAWWVAPQFGLGAIMVMSAARRLPGKAKTGVLPALVWFLGAYLASCLIGHWGMPLGLLFVWSFLARMRVEGRSSRQLNFALGLAVCGCLWEAGLSSTGVFWYCHDNVGIVPAWLFGLYLHGAPLAWEFKAVMGQTRGDGSEDPDEG